MHWSALRSPNNKNIKRVLSQRPKKFCSLGSAGNSREIKLSNGTRNEWNPACSDLRGPKAATRGNKIYNRGITSKKFLFLDSGSQYSSPGSISLRKDFAIVLIGKYCIDNIRCDVWLLSSFLSFSSRLLLPWPLTFWAISCQETLSNWLH